MYQASSFEQMTDWTTTNKKRTHRHARNHLPHCSKAFKIDEAGYADILKQVRDGAFEQQLHERLELAEQDKRNAVELAQAQVAREKIGVRENRGQTPILPPITAILLIANPFL